MAEAWEKLLPEPARSSGVSLKPLGINETSWPISCAEMVVSTLLNGAYAILGGDIYFKEATTFVPAYENWSCAVALGEQWSVYAQRSCNEAMQYLLSHSAQTNRWFTIVATSKPSAAELVASYAR